MTTRFVKLLEMLLQSTDLSSIHAARRRHGDAGRSLCGTSGTDDGGGAPETCETRRRTPAETEAACWGCTPACRRAGEDSQACTPEWKACTPACQACTPGPATPLRRHSSSACTPSSTRRAASSGETTMETTGSRTSCGRDRRRRGPPGRKAGASPRTGRRTTPRGGKRPSIARGDLGELGNSEDDESGLFVAAAAIDGAAGEESEDADVIVNRDGSAAI